MRYFTIIFAFIFTSCLNKFPDSVSIDSEIDPVFLNKKYVSEINLNEFNEIGKIYYFIKVWGFLKYNADINSVDLDWDEYYVKNIDNVSKLNREEFLIFINNTINIFPLPSEISSKNKLKNYSLIDNNWFNNDLYFDEIICKKLKKIFENKDDNSNEYLSQTNTGVVKLDNEKNYSEIEFPNKKIRLLGLSRYWNFINYFYVYKNDMDENWDKILLESIEKFISVKNTADYHLATVWLTSKLYDCHSITDSKILDKEIYGRFTPNFRVKLIDTTFIVTKIRVEKINNQKVKVGDIILKINDIDIRKKYMFYDSIMNGANILSEQRIINTYLFSSTKNKIKLLILRNDKKIEIDLLLDDYSKYVDEEKKVKDKCKDSLVVKYYLKNTAYLDLEYISEDNFDKNFDNVKKYKNLILDIRNYPESQVVLDIAKFILPKKSDFFSSSYADISKPGLLRIHKGYKLGKDNSENYKGNVYVLANENTQSMAEFLIMALQSSKNVKTIGSMTAGSDGNVTYFNFPGNIKTSFSGIGIYYPNFKPTQRIGVKMDIKINESVKDIQMNRDIILLKTLELIK